MNFYQFMIPRLNGKDIEKDFGYYLRLVRKGIAGFIIFGGELEPVRHGIKKLQNEAMKPLIIASDLEQGLGQQLAGGTLFPPAMAIASAIKKSYKLQVTSYKLQLLRDTFRAIALEARYAGINTIFAPVLDINTNPRNPIIATRAFGEDPRTVSFFGCEMIKTLQSNGIVSCGKHFPGHGDTEIDSHIGLPVVKKDLKSLEKIELMPFKTAIKQGVKMIMLGHLKVPAMDSSGIPVSLSKRAVRYLRDKMGFKGLIVTDALNMGGIGRYSEEKAALMALEAGVNLLLHPSDPEKVAAYLQDKLPDVSYQLSGSQFKRKKAVTLVVPDFEKDRLFSEEVSKRAVRIDGELKLIKKPVIIILNEDVGSNGKALHDGLKHKYRSMKHLSYKHGDKVNLKGIKKDNEIIVAVFSKIKAWKGGPSPWLFKSLKDLEDKTEIFISFGSPYLLDIIKKDCAKVYAYWDSEIAQKAVAELI